MADLAFITTSTLTDICDAVRVKKNMSSEEKIPTEEIASEIGSIETGADVRNVTATASSVLSPKVFVDKNGDEVTGTITTMTSDDLIVNGATVRVTPGYYSIIHSKSVNEGKLGNPTLTFDGRMFAVERPIVEEGYMYKKTVEFPGLYNPSDLDSNLAAENIKSGVSIFGVDGSYTGSSTGVDVSGVTATAADVLSPKVFVDQNGEEVTGTIVTRTVSGITVDGADVSVSSGYYSEDVNLSIDTGELNPPSIRFNVLSGKLNAMASVSKSGYLSDGSTKHSQVSPVELEETLVPENIKSGISIFGVEGVLDASPNTITEDLNETNVLFDPDDHNVYIYTTNDIASIENLSLCFVEDGYATLTVVWSGISYSCFTNFLNGICRHSPVGCLSDGSKAVHINVSSGIESDDCKIEFEEFDSIVGSITYVSA